MKEVLFLSPEFKYRIWGGTRLKEFYNQTLPFENTGEAWAISAHKNGPSTVLNGPYKSMTLDHLYSRHRNLFGNVESNEFPLLIKIIDANDDLSVQVHPDDQMAKQYHSLGKTECWYILDASEDAYIIYGHKALSKADFLECVEHNKWDNLLNKVPVKKGDFFFIPAGMVHALGKGIVILETQQSSDITYRLYDYDRIDKDNQKRELHLDLGVEATKIPSPVVNTHVSEHKVGQNLVTHLIHSEFFSVEKYELQEPYLLENKQYRLITFLEGSGKIGEQTYKKGDSCIVTNDINNILISPSNFTLFISSYI
ncbi:class I mannose-6-phosphate isomerase [Acholeplasma vituli]|uniref:Phosphohexomutase n=1 Tax=Paracholeplasma vituli TaxID=69473 RepID=A0ABT2PT28_9MOLU|nr:type I phosphomannose isomerase catalytic subunit [Paracholeplasma vituli]MCU0104106.1 class I mannose-6-phosphate isomerase [Paracholeplasma vituli]